MEKRNLGNTGTKVGALGIGAMSFSDFYGPTNTQESHAILKMALDNGIDHIDTAKVYGMGLSEERIGQLVRKAVRKLRHPSRGLNELWEAA